MGIAMDLETGVELLGNLEGMRLHCEGVISDMADRGFLRGIRRAVAERELSDIRNRIGQLKMDLAEVCDREIVESGAHAASLMDIMSVARTYSGLSTRAAMVASACRNWRESEAREMIEDFAKSVDGLPLETRISLIDSIDDVEDSDLDLVRMSTFLRSQVSREGVKAVAAKMDGLSATLGLMAQEGLDLAWAIRAQIVGGEMAAPSPALVETVGRLTGKQVAYADAPMP